MLTENAFVMALRKFSLLTKIAILSMIEVVQNRSLSLKIWLFVT